MRQILINKFEILNKCQIPIFNCVKCLLLETLKFKYCLGFGPPEADWDLGFISL